MQSKTIINHEGITADRTGTVIDFKDILTLKTQQERTEAIAAATFVGALYQCSLSVVYANRDS
ncbi:hypothetical protein [Alkalimarinus coralli]|uniref:hypothetical protein n=1 Tax=Alkalimarinus coralli TaxID=2935863 RepID=UPI00202B17C3|nr:hypothetical protein [Alkalimarinus coralli]